MSFNNSYGEEPGKARASCSSAGFHGAVHLPAPVASARVAEHGRGVGLPHSGRGGPSARSLSFQAGGQGPPPTGLPAWREEVEGGAD